jgi:hypothetical protein
MHGAARQGGPLHPRIPRHYAHAREASSQEPRKTTPWRVAAPRRGPALRASVQARAPAGSYRPPDEAIVRRTGSICFVLVPQLGKVPRQPLMPMVGGRKLRAAEARELKQPCMAPATREIASIAPPILRLSVAF